MVNSVESMTHFTNNRKNFDVLTGWRDPNVLLPFLSSLLILEPLLRWSLNLVDFVSLV